MSLFQCQLCGCCENTALSGQGCDGYAEGFYDWTGLEDRKGKKLCSACAPTLFEDDTRTEFGSWHGQFPRVFLPLGQFRTARNGNLEHVETGDQDFRKYAIESQADAGGESSVKSGSTIDGGVEPRGLTNETEGERDG